MDLFFPERKNPVLVILRRIKGHQYNHPISGLHTKTAHKSSAGGKGITIIKKDPIRKLSHHKVRTVFSSTSTECQRALNNILKVSTLSIITYMREMKKSLYHAQKS